MTDRLQFGLEVTGEANQGIDSFYPVNGCRGVILE
jgi:hypothetical protein